VLDDTPDPRPAPIRAIVCLIGSPDDDREGRLELRPWPDASAEERECAPVALSGDVEGGPVVIQVVTGVPRANCVRASLAKPRFLHLATVFGLILYCSASPFKTR
jgi:hypothetical protein